MCLSVHLCSRCCTEYSPWFLSLHTSRNSARGENKARPPQTRTTRMSTPALLGLHRRFDSAHKSKATSNGGLQVESQATNNADTGTKHGGKKELYIYNIRRSYFCVCTPAVVCRRRCERPFPFQVPLCPALPPTKERRLLRFPSSCDACLRHVGSSITLSCLLTRFLVEMAIPS